MKASTLVAAVAELTVVAGAGVLVPVHGPLLIGPLAALAIGIGVVWYEVAETGGSSAGRGLRLGAVAGVGALIGSVIAFTVVLAVIGSNPAVQEFVRASEPHPEARIPADMIPALGALTGVLAGLAFGAFNLALSAFGGLFAGLFAECSEGPKSAHRLS
jgi:hypothetical protein